MNIHTETIEGARIGDLLPRVVELTQEAVAAGQAYHISREVLPDGRNRVTVSVWPKGEA
jgi:hypothetical protein